MVSRIRENYHEAIRKDFANDLSYNARILDTPLILRHADAEAINKARFNYFRIMEEEAKRMTQSTGDADDMEKCRASKGDYKLDCREFSLHSNFEQEYYNFYGHGYNGSPVVDKPGAPYKCLGCGVSMEMSMKTAPEECPICHRLTPLGEMVRDGWNKRHG